MKRVLLIFIVCFGASCLQAAAGDVVDFHKRVADIVVKAVAAVDARLGGEKSLQDAGNMAEPQKRFDNLMDSIEAFLARGWNVDAYLAAYEAYYIRRAYSVDCSPKQHLAYYKAIISLKGPSKFYKPLRAFVQNMDTADRAAAYNALMYLADVSLQCNDPETAVEACMNALGYAAGETDSVAAFTTSAFAALDANDMLTYNSLLSGLESVVRPESEQYVNLLNLKANAADYLGRPSRELRQQYSEAVARVYGESSPQGLYAANKLLVGYTSSGRMEEGRKLLERMAGDIERNSGHVYFGELLFNIGGFLEKSGFDGGIDIMEAALEHAKNTVGGLSYNTGTQYSYLAWVYYNRGDYARAAELQDYARAIKYNCFGHRAPSIIGDYANLTAYLTSAGDYKEAARVAQSMLTAYREGMSTFFMTMTEKERFDFLNNERYLNALGNLLPQLSLVRLLDGPTAYNAMLSYRGILLASETDMRSRLLAAGDEAVLADFDALRAARKRMERMSPQSDTSVRQRLEKQADSLERSLLTRLNGSGNGLNPGAITYSDVRDCLKKGEAAVEFVRACFDDGVFYGAVGLTPYGRPVVVRLFHEKEIDAIPADEYFTTSRLYDILWKPLLTALGSPSKIYFAPSERFNGIAIEYLPDSAGVPVNERLGVYRLTSTRELALHEGKTRARPDNVALFGGINYYPDEDEVLEAMAEVEPAERGVERSAPDKSRFISAVSYLPGTLAEVKDIGALFAADGITPRVHTGAEGSEEIFKSLEKSGVNCLHIATHGFYIPGEDAVGEDEMLRRSGLLLAGAGVDLAALVGNDVPEPEDGVLTAREIADMNLEHLDLVVLSACETGLGSLGADGVFGLQRGFKKAGAGSILMSLSKVDDEATRILMTAFYRNLLAGRSKIESLALAQKELRRADNGRFDNPRYWAPFIIVDALD